MANTHWKIRVGSSPPKKKKQRINISILKAYQKLIKEHNYTWMSGETKATVQETM